MNTPFIPDHYGMTYVIDDVKKSFRQYRLSTCQKIKLTDLIRTEKNNGYNSTTGAENLLKIRDKTNWSKCTITGLRPDNSNRFYYGDLPINGKKSLMVCHFTDDWETIHIRICPQFYPMNSTDRNRIILEMINKITDENINEL